MVYRNIQISGVNYPKTPIGIAKLERICDAAMDIFVTQNFYETSINDICKRARIAIGTFYIYFADKVALYNFLLFNIQADIMTELKHSIKRAKCTSRIQMEREGIKAYIYYVINNPLIYNIVWGSLSIDPTGFNNYYRAFAQSYSRSLERYRDELAEDVDITTLTWCLQGITTFLGLQIHLGQPKDISDEAVEKMLDHTMSMLTKGIYKREV